VARSAPGPITASDQKKGELRDAASTRRPTAGPAPYPVTGGSGDGLGSSSADSDLIDALVDYGEEAVAEKVRAGMTGEQRQSVSERLAKLVYSADPARRDGSGYPAMKAMAQAAVDVLDGPRRIADRCRAGAAKRDKDRSERFWTQVRQAAQNAPKPKQRPLPGGVELPPEPPGISQMSTKEVFSAVGGGLEASGVLDGYTFRASTAKFTRVSVPWNQQVDVRRVVVQRLGNQCLGGHPRVDPSQRAS
jgi:hypothetical protein